MGHPIETYAFQLVLFQTESYYDRRCHTTIRQALVGKQTNVYDTVWSIPFILHSALLPY